MEVVLVSHDPFKPELDTAYRSASPIFLHAEACLDRDPDPLPIQLTRRSLNLCMFDANGDMLDATLCDGSDLEDGLVRAFANPHVVEVHIHNLPRRPRSATDASSRGQRRSRVSRRRPATIRPTTAMVTSTAM